NRRGGTSANSESQASSSRHAELGVKTVVPGRMRLSAALFVIVPSNEIVVDQSSGGRASFKNVGHADRKGIELGAERMFPGPFEARIAYTYLKATFREAFATVVTLPPVTVNVPAGSLLPGVPKNVLYGELRYRAE